MQNPILCVNSHPQGGHGGVVGQLLGAEANKDAADKDGKTPLHNAAKVCMPYTILASQAHWDGSQVIAH